MVDKPTDNVDFIEIIEPVLDNQAFVLAIAGGVIIGAIAFYAWLEYQKSHTTGTKALEAVEYVEDAIEQAHDGQTVPTPNIAGTEWPAN